MRRFLALLLSLLTMLTLLCQTARAELGFAEVAKTKVNMRRSPGGEAFHQVDSPQSVYVFEEKTDGENLWCHVYTYIGKNPRDGWIRGDMLRFLSEEFTDILDVEASDKYVFGVRSDGTVAIMGDDMPHSPCIDAVREWTDISQVCGYSVGVQALTEGGMVLAVGRQSNLDGMRAAKICGDYAYPIGKDGDFLCDEWKSTGMIGDLEGLRGLSLQEAAGHEWMISAALTTDGEMVILPDASLTGHYSWTDWLLEIEHAFVNGPYTDIEQYFANLIALRADGRVEASSLNFPEASRTQEWENVVQVAAGSDFTLGLKADGTVYFAGDDPTHARQVEAWENVVDIAAGDDFCVALLKNGRVVMAGEFKDGYFR